MKCRQNNCRHSDCLSFTRRKQENVVAYGYNIGGYTLQRVKNQKILGVIIDDKLKWDDHISYICKNATKLWGFVRRTLAGTTTNVKLEAYKTLIRTKLEYASIVWDPYLDVQKNALERIQRNAARY